MHACNYGSSAVSSVVVAALAIGLCAASAACVVADETKATAVLVVVGPSTHPPGTHEVAAGARLVAHCLEHAANVRGIDAEVMDQWPTDRAMLARVATVVFLGDQFPPDRFDDADRVRADLAAMAAHGCGIVCIHFATGLRPENIAADGEHPLLHWIGGYFSSRGSHHQSVARVMTATIEPANGSHPVLRGWKSFTLEDEPYYNNYFGKQGLADGVTAVAYSMLPPEAPKKEIVAWAVERADGGRGMGIVMPHFYRNWRVDDLRKCILNGIVWTAKRDVPPEGVETATPDLASFEPAAVEAAPRPQRAKQ